MGAGLTIPNYPLQLQNLVLECQHHETLFFFCKQGLKTVVEESIKFNTKEMIENTNLDSSDCQGTLGGIMTDLQVFDSKTDGDHPLLSSEDYLTCLEAAIDEIDYCVRQFLERNLPNGCYEVNRFRWQGDILFVNMRMATNEA